MFASVRFSCVLALFVLSSKNRLVLPTTGAPQPGAPAETAEDDEEHDADDVTAEIVSTVAGHGLLCVRHGPLHRCVPFDGADGELTA